MSEILKILGRKWQYVIDTGKQLMYYMSLTNP